jgi:hypothetical protein
MTYQEHLKKLGVAVAASVIASKAVQAARGNHAAMTAALDAVSAAQDNALAEAEAAAAALKKENEAIRRPWWCWCC